MSLRLTFAILMACYVNASAAEMAPYTRLHVVPGERATPAEQKSAQLLIERIRRQGAGEARLGAPDSPGTEELTVYLGVPERHESLARLCTANAVALPDRKDPGAEGFVLRSVPNINGGSVILAAATDERGVLYAVGEILRRTVNRGDRFEFPADIDFRTAPAFRYRGTEVSQGATITELTHSRSWTDAEWQQVVLDYALAGANTFAVGHVSPTGLNQFEFIKSYGLNTQTSISPNGGSGPPEWNAREAIGRTGHLCLSVPAARQSILDTWQRNAPGFDYDYVRFYSGDGGGCECEKCAPYGKKYIEMCADIANIILKHHPDVKFFATNQKLDNAGDQAIFDYLNAEPRPWLTALCYGPGSNAMGWQPGRRQDHRMDLFEYPAFGPDDRYIREIVHQLPPQQKLVFFTDATHWVYSEYGLVASSMGPDRNGDVPPHWGRWVYEQRPDQAMYRVYNRRTFHARPKRYYDAFHDTERYGEGDVTYSEGHHDQFNQWMWQRLLWNPHVSLDEILDEYGRVWFGPEAAPSIAQALLQLERNLSTPIADNPGIDRYRELVKEAGARMPDYLLKSSYLWRQHMQRADVDKYIQLRLRRQTVLQKEVEDLVTSAIQKNEIDSGVALARERQAADIETDEMKALKAEAGKLGEESDVIFGVRNEGWFNLDRDFIGLAWIRKQVDEAAGAQPERRRELLTSVVRYEDPGEGGFYDDAGNPAKSPHLVYGLPGGGGGGADSSRPSQRTVAVTREEKQGVTFEYKDLDPNAKYRARFTFVRPRVAERFADKQPQKTQSVYADDALLAKDVELPVQEPKFFEYDIPETVTRDGQLQLRLEKSAGVGEGTPTDIEIWRNTGGWGTMVSEVWLVKR